MTVVRESQSPAILYVASRLPELSETFVYRELFGLRSRGRTVIGASVHAPQPVVDDVALTALADEVVIAYGVETAAVLPIALVRHPLIFARALSDAMRADHANLKSRLKHAVQAAMGIALAWRVRKHGIGHVHAHMAHVPTTVGLYIARALGARFSFTGHAADLFVQRAALQFKLERSDFVSSISNWHQQFYREIAGLDAGRTPLIRCSVAVPAAIFDHSKEIVTVARLVPKKGIDLLIKSFASATLHGWRLRILGDGPERGSLEQLVATFGVSGLVTFEGAQPHARCLAVIARSGMFVLPCRTARNGDKDGIPVVLMEAMAAARPVVGGDLPTIRELIDDGETGLLVEPDHEGALMTAMRRIASNGDFAKELGINARAFVQREFSDEVNLDRLCAALERAGTPA
ncbi:MAG: glycosyl transferase group 1 [Bradyrhizobium sp.]|nr:glycosyl transferase group 1 [Bradyrhizobium sp.]